MSATDNCTAITTTDGGCAACLQRLTACFWCDSSAKCLPVKGGAFLIDVAACPGYQWKWGQCMLDGIGIAILLALLIIVILISVCAITCCIICCCRRRMKRKESDTTSECEYLREREAIRAKHSRRKEENQLKRDEIRKKYGLFHDISPQ